MTGEVAETLDARAERLQATALDLACRLRDEDPAAVKRAVVALPPGELVDLVMLLAAMLPVDLPESVLLGWWRHPPRGGLRPCGTVSAAKRHQAAGQPLDEACDWVLREHDRVRSRDRHRSTS